MRELRSRISLKELPVGKTVHEVRVRVMADGLREIRPIRWVRNGHSPVGKLVTSTRGVSPDGTAEIEAFLAPLIGLGIRQVVGEVKG